MNCTIVHELTFGRELRYSALRLMQYQFMTDLTSNHLKTNLFERVGFSFIFLYLAR